MNLLMAKSQIVLIVTTVYKKRDSTMRELMYMLAVFPTFILAGCDNNGDQDQSMAFKATSINDYKLGMHVSLTSTDSLACKLIWSQEGSSIVFVSPSIGLKIEYYNKEDELLREQVEYIPIKSAFLDRRERVYPFSVPIETKPSDDYLIIHLGSPDLMISERLDLIETE